NPSVVWVRVCGISITLNRSARTSTSVRLTPSTATEPLSTISSPNSGGNPNQTVSHSSFATRSAMRPVQSTWPVTKCPPSRSRAEPDADPQRRRQVPPVARPQSAQVRLRQRLDPGLEREPPAVHIDDGQTRPVHRDALAEFQLRGESRLGDDQRPAGGGVRHG